jgi:hypothetical protein
MVPAAAEPEAGLDKRRLHNTIRGGCFAQTRIAWGQQLPSWLGPCPWQLSGISTHRWVHGLKLSGIPNKKALRPCERTEAIYTRKEQYIKVQEPLVALCLGTYCVVVLFGASIVTKFILQQSPAVVPCSHVFVPLHLQNSISSEGALYSIQFATTLTKLAHQVCKEAAGSCCWAWEYHKPDQRKAWGGIDSMARISCT